MLPSAAVDLCEPAMNSMRYKLIELMQEQTYQVIEEDAINDLM
jgi:hypothetical protein